MNFYYMMPFTSTPSLIPTISNQPPMVPDETASWKKITNSVYNYSIKAPTDFTLALCKDCNPSEVGFSLSNSIGTVHVGASFAAQWSLTYIFRSKPNGYF